MDRKDLPPRREIRRAGKILPPPAQFLPALAAAPGARHTGRSMTRDELIDCCRAKPYATADFPFDDVTLVVRVGGKMFALVALDAEPPSVNLKCDPEAAGDLRATYPAITPGRHMNKEHWNTVRLDGSLPEELERALADRSYDLVLDGLSAREREKAGIPPKAPAPRRSPAPGTRRGRA